MRFKRFITALASAALAPQDSHCRICPASLIRPPADVDEAMNRC